MMKADMAQTSMIILAMMSVYFENVVFYFDMDLLEIVETSHNRVERLSLIPTEIKTQ